MDNEKNVDVEKVINGLKWCSETAKEKGCIGCPYGYQVKDDIRCHLKKLIAESLAVILDLQTQIKVMQESYDEVIAEQVKIAETATAEKFAERVKEETDHGISALYDSTVDEICKEITEETV